MDFDDRLRNHLHTQSSDLELPREGTDAVRARSKHRKQRRAGASMLAVLAVAMLGGGWLVGRAGDTDANLATDGDGIEAPNDSIGSASRDDTADAIEIDNALPEPGAALTFEPVDTNGAPGGYNVYVNGRSSGVYYVLSTAPGVTNDEQYNGEFARNDTVYTFDGSRWSQSSVSDRYVSNFDSSAAGVLYAISTGSPTQQALEIGTSTNAGTDWTWTEIDLTSAFGIDRSAWPAYSVQFATAGDERLVVVHTNDNVDWDEATQLAISGGADIAESSQILSVDRNGISWFDEQPRDECQAAHFEAMSTLFDAEPGGPDFDYSRELTPQEQAEVDAYYQAQDARVKQIEAEALRSVASIPGCEPFVKCSNGLAELAVQNTIETREALANVGIDLDANDEMTEDQLIMVEAVFAAESEKVNAWATESGCADVLQINTEGEGFEAGENYATWAELGVTIPDSWGQINNAFLVNNARSTDLGDVFGGQSGFLVDVSTTGSGWSVTFDAADYSGEQATASYTVWTSTDGVSWASNITDHFTWNDQARLADGSTFAVRYAGESNQIIRTSPDGTTNALALADLAPGIDTTGYTILNVKAGEYGVVTWAIKWQDNPDGFDYESLVIYSPDGTGWGVTEVPGLEVIDAIVGDDGVMIFLNDPARADGTAQPIMFGAV